MPFAGVDADGRRRVVTADGSVKPTSVVIEDKNDAEGVTRASGTLDQLAKLQRDGILTPKKPTDIIEVVTREAPIRFPLASDENVERAVLKIVLHFVAGFVSDIPSALAGEVLTALVSCNDFPRGRYVRTPSFAHDVFVREWPPRHELCCVRGEDGVYATVLLFGACPYVCRLPIVTTLSETLLYRQPLVGDVRPSLTFATSRPDVETMYTSRHPFEAYGAELRSRLNDISRYARLEQFRAQIKRTALAADANTTFGGTAWDKFRAELQLEAVPADEIDSLIRCARAALASGKHIWDLDFGLDDSETNW